MTQKATNQKGFAALEALLIVIILAIIGGTGYYVYHANSKSTDTQNAAQTDANSATPHKTATKSAALKYTTVSEWGVRAPYTGSLKLQYTLSADGNQANFTSAELLAADSECTDQFGGQIDRYAPTDIATPDGTGTTTAKERAAQSSKTTYAYVGGYYYFFTHSQSACGSDPDKTKALQQQTNAAVEALVPKLQAVPAQ